MQKIMRDKTLAILDHILIVIYTIWLFPYIKNILFGRPLFGEYGILNIGNGITLQALSLIIFWMFLVEFFIKCATVISIDHEKIICSFLFIKFRIIYWTNIECIGVFEQGILRKSKKYKKYIYISDEIPTLETRLQMCIGSYSTVESKHRICINYTNENLKFMQSIWNGFCILDLADSFYNDENNSELDKQIMVLEKENQQLKVQKEELLSSLDT